MPFRTENTYSAPGIGTRKIKRRHPKPKTAPPAPKANRVPDGPYPGESSNPKVRRRARNSRKKAREQGKTPLTPYRPKKGPQAGPSKRYLKEDRQNSAARRALSVPSLQKSFNEAHTPAALKAQKLTEKALSTLREGTKDLPPDPHTAILNAARYGTKLNGKEAKTFKLLNGEKAYSEVERARMAYIGAHENLGEPEDLTNLITLGIPAGFGAAQIAKEGFQIGGKALLAKAGETLAGEGEKAVLKAAATKDIPKTATRVVRNVARRVTGKDAIKAAAKPVAKFDSHALPGTGAIKFAGAQTFPVVKGHEKAVIEHPITTAKTTARALPGLVTVPVGMAADVGISAGRAGSDVLHAAHIPGFKHYSGADIVGPLKGQAKAQLEFAKQVAKVVTADDTKEVQEAVEHELGLMLPIMAALGTKAATKPWTKGKIEAFVRKTAENARSKVGHGHGKFRGKNPRVFEKAGQHKEEAIRAANAKARIQREVADRTKTVREEAGKAKGSEVVRKKVVRKKKFGINTKADLTIHTGDIAGFVVRHGLPLDKPGKALAEVKRIKAQLKDVPASIALPNDRLNTRDVINFIEKNPEVLKDKHLARQVAAYKDQAKYARETPGLSPEHSERARFASAAGTRDVPLPENRFPKSVEDVVRAQPKSDTLAKDVLRKEARRDRARAKKLKKKAATREGRARAVRSELGVRNRVEPGRAVNARLEALAARYESQAKTYRQGAAKAEKMATRKHKAATEIDPTLQTDFVKEMQDILHKEGMHEPEYIATSRAKEMPGVGATGNKLTQFPGKSKFRKGTADQMGIVEEGIGPLLRKSIAEPVSRRESYKAMRGFLNDNEFRHGGKSEFTATEARKLFDNGVIDRNRYVLVPRQLYNRAYGKFDPTEAAATLKHSIDNGDAVNTAVKGRQYKIVRKAAAEEFFDQLQGSYVSPRLAKINRVTSGLILGTSPAWAAMQIVAETAQAAIAEPRVLDPRFVKRAIKAYKDMPAHKRQALESWTGITTRTIESPEHLKLDLQAGDVEAAAEAYGALHTTPLGKFIRAIPQSIRNIDQWKGGRIRLLTTAAKLDKETNGHLAHFLQGVRGLDAEMGKQLDAMKGKPLSEQLSFVADHPQFAKRYQTYLDDVMGNWNALTKNERIASQMMIFYPFIRMSIRWTFYSFPKTHPIKAAISYYLGQQNANQLEQLLEGPPSFSKWAQVPLHLGNGKTKIVDLSRVAPGANTLTESLGGEIEGPKGIIAARMTQPIISALGTAIYGVTPLIGKQKPNSGWNALAQLLSLSPLSRQLSETAVPGGQKRVGPTADVPVVNLFGHTERQHALDKLFNKLNEYHTVTRAARNLALPVIPKRVDYTADTGKLQRILHTMDANSEDNRKSKAAELSEQNIPAKKARKQIEQMEQLYSEASNELDGLFKKYNIPFQKEDARFGERYGQIYYGSEPSGPTSIGGTTISGAPESSQGGKTTIGGTPVSKASKDSKEGGTSIGGVPLGKDKRKKVRRAKPQQKNTTTIGGVPINTP